jgi:transcriptional regulator with XRE-family HTH domain
MVDVYTEAGNRLRQARERIGESQAGIEQLTQGRIRQSTLSRLEKVDRKMNLNVLPELCKVLNASPFWMLGSLENNRYDCFFHPQNEHMIDVSLLPPSDRENVIGIVNRLTRAPSIAEIGPRRQERRSGQERRVTDKEPAGE